MKKTLWAVIFLALYCTPVQAQFNGKPARFGVGYLQNFSAQINYNPQVPEDGRFQWNTLHSSGVGLFYERFFSEKFSVTALGSYQVKGYKEIAQIAEVFIPDSFRENEYVNKFRYLTLELNPTYYFSRSNVVVPFVSLGLNGNFLLSYKLGSNVYPIKNFYPVNEYDRFRRLSLGFNLSSGLVISNLLVIEGKFQRDITPILDKPNLQIWNWVWSLNFRLNINQIITDARNKNA